MRSFFQRALRAFVFLRALPALAFLSVSNFLHALRAFTFLIKCGTAHNQPLQKTKIA